MEALVGASARELLVDWLRGARLQAPGGLGRTGMFQGTDAEDRGRANDEITFPTTARTPLSGRNTLIRLYIDHDDETPERGLVAELTRRVIDEPRRIELVPQADQLDIRYRPDIEEEDAEWMPDWGGATAAPAGGGDGAPRGTGGFPSRAPPVPDSRIAAEQTMTGRREGFVLIAVLWLLVALGAVALDAALRSRARNLTAANFVDEARARGAAQAGVEYARSRLTAAVRDREEELRGRRGGRNNRRGAGYGGDFLLHRGGDDGND